MVEVCIVIVVGTGGGDGVLGASPSCHIVVGSSSIVVASFGHILQRGPLLQRGHLLQRVVVRNLRTLMMPPRHCLIRYWPSSSSSS